MRFFWSRDRRHRRAKLWACQDCHTVKAVWYEHIELVPCAVCSGTRWVTLNRRAVRDDLYEVELDLEHITEDQAHDECAWCGRVNCPEPGHLPDDQEAIYA